jgi:hypothetical protein
MFPEPDHDARIVTETLGTQALAFFFCGGEIGPVGGKTFLHASDPPALILFRPRSGRDWRVSQDQLPDRRCPRIAAPGGTPSAEECTGETG